MCDCTDKSACKCQSGTCRGGNKDAWKSDLADLYLCEPYCGNGGCTVSLCSTKSVARSRTEEACRTALAALVQAEQLLYKNTEQGPAVVFPNGVTILVRDFCRIGCGEDDCERFGPHFNREARVSDFSPSDVESVAKAWSYSSEALLHSALTEGGFLFISGRWRMGFLAPLGVSHTFCLEEIRVRTRYRYIAAAGGGAPIYSAWLPTPVTAVAIGGVAVACGTGQDQADTGSYVRVLQVPQEADPESIDTTPERCACEELCGFTPARGAEVFYFKVDLPEAPAAPDGYTLDGMEPLDVNVKVRRCDWLSIPDDMLCVNATGNRKVVNRIANLTTRFPTEVRAVGGEVPFLA